MKKIIIVGGVAGGASFAARMRRLDESAEIIMFEKGEYISFANCGLPYHIGGTISDRDNLIIQTPEKFKARFNVDIRTRSEVIRIDTTAKAVTVRCGEETYNENYDYLVLTPGADSIRPPVPGIDSRKVMTLRSIPDMDRIKKSIDSQNVKRVTVIGGGFIGLEMAENLRKRGLDVTLIELSDQVFAPADPEMAQILNQHLQLNSVSLLLNEAAAGFNETGDGAVTVTMKSGKRIVADLIVLAIGVKPDTAFIKASGGIELNEKGAIVVDNHLRTSVPDVYAAGDAIEVTDLVAGKKVHVPLAGPANRQGRIIADNIAGIDAVYKDTQGTAICKIFDLTAAVSGLNEKNARRWGIKYAKSYTHSASHAGYYPGSFPLSIKILFNPDNGKLLGAQVIGRDGVDKRIDIYATAIRHGLTVADLADLELSYAPPYGSAKDAVNISGFVAQNIMNGTMPVWYAEEFASIKQEDVIYLDVRTEAERQMGFIGPSMHITVDELRERMNEVPKLKPVYIYCQIGLRGHVAARIMMQQGYTVKNLSGGYKTFATVNKSGSESEYLKPVTEAVCSSPTTDMPKRNRIIDACGLQCPGPVLKLKTAMESLTDGEIIEIHATDQGFASDIPSWCIRTRNSLVSLSNENGMYKAVVRKGPANDVCTVSEDKDHHKTMVIFSGDFDKAMAAFIIANGAASMGSEVTLFFTFWGLNLLRRDQNVKVKKNLIEKMFGMMMPRGAGKLTLSKMHMAGMGTAMIREVMKKKNVYSLETLMIEARKNGVRFVACSMSMDIMGIKKEELIDGVEIGGVANYLEHADNAGYNLFI